MCVAVALLQLSSKFSKWARAYRKCLCLRGQLHVLYSSRGTMNVHSRRNHYPVSVCRAALGYTKLLPSLQREKELHLISNMFLYDHSPFSPHCKLRFAVFREGLCKRWMRHSCAVF